MLTRRLNSRCCRFGLFRPRYFAEWFVVGLFRTPTFLRLQRSFFAWGDAPEAEALDALAQPWNFCLAYAFPPPLLRVVRKIAVLSGIFLLVTPFWPAQKWFPAVLGLQVMDVHRLPAMPEVIDLTSSLHPLSHLLLVWRLRGLAVSDASFRLI